MKRFDFGVCEWALSLRGEAFCKAMADLGVANIQLGLWDDATAGKGLGDKALVDEYDAARKKYGIHITGVDAAALDSISAVNPKTQQEQDTALRMVDLAIEIASRLEAKNVIFPTFNANEIKDDRIFGTAVDIIKDKCKRAKSYGLSLYIESNLNAEKFRKLISEVNDPECLIYFDSQNHYLNDRTDMAKLFTDLADIIGETHIKDGVQDDLSGALLGEGTSGFFAFADAVKKSSYSGLIYTENYYSQPPLSAQGDQLELLKKDLATMKKTFAE